MNQARLVTTILYLRRQKEFYCNQMEDLEILYHWLSSGSKSIENYPTAEFFPDICGNCLASYDRTMGGRVRLHCRECFNYAWSNVFLKYHWPGRMAGILRTNETVLETYLAIALSLISRHRKGEKEIEGILIQDLIINSNTKQAHKEIESEHAYNQ